MTQNIAIGPDAQINHALAVLRDAVTEGEIRVETPYGALPVIQLNHCTTDIYRFDRIPYYPLTEDSFLDIYARRFRRNAALRASDWRAAFAARARAI